jgi:hypothetical protein
MRLNAGAEVTHAMPRNLRRNLALMLAVAALSSGCGSHSPEAGPAGQAASKIAARKPVSPTDELSPNMVSAVASNKPSALPLQVKFELRDRPGIGQPVDVDLAIVPMSASVDRVSGKVEGEDGLDLIEGGEIAASDRPVEGVPIRHSIKVLPRREGIFTVRAVLTVDASGVSTTESYSLPVIASTATAEDPPTPATAPAAAPAAPAPARISEAHPGAPATAASQ